MALQERLCSRRVEMKRLFLVSVSAIALLSTSAIAGNADVRRMRDQVREVTAEAKDKVKEAIAKSSQRDANEFRPSKGNGKDSQDKGDGKKERSNKKGKKDKEGKDDAEDNGGAVIGKDGKDGNGKDGEDGKDGIGKGSSEYGKGKDGIGKDANGSNGNNGDAARS